MISQKIGLRRGQHPPGQFSCHPSRDDDSCLATLAAKLVDDAGYRVRRRGYDREARLEGECLDASVARPPENDVMARVDETNLARKATTQEILRDMQPDGTRPLAGAHQNGTFGMKQEIEVPDGHGALRRLRFWLHAPATMTQRLALMAYCCRKRKL